MPPPPLSDEEVRQRVLPYWENRNWWMWYQADLGIYENERDELIMNRRIINKCPPEDKERYLQMIQNIYRREWERAYCYGLAEEAQSAILTALLAPENPDTLLASILVLPDDLTRIRRAINAMCDADHDAWGITKTDKIRKPRQPTLRNPLRNRRRRRRFLRWVSVALICILLWLLSQSVVWLISALLCLFLAIWGVYVAIVLHLDPYTYETRIEPRVTFRELAELIREVALGRATKMQEAAQRQVKYPHA